MACTRLYDFINGTMVDLPTAADADLNTGGACSPLLRPDAEAERVLGEHARLLAEMAGAAPAF
ncbi:MAG TPA: hypothetical protein ENO23_03950 [Alphaproteobacteria bacterium]|nr:hypothetical protein [Alphaproteobacteria bacterium]